MKQHVLTAVTALLALALLQETAAQTNQTNTA
jgi:hypothetical protein